MKKMKDFNNSNVNDAQMIIRSTTQCAKSSIKIEGR